MVIELAEFRVHPGAEEQLVADRPRMLAALRERFPGCLAAYLTRQDDGSFLDVIVWRDRASAERAAAGVDGVPECAEWFGHIASSGGLRHVEVLDHWPADGAAPAGAGDAGS